jgi:hypothetical protein
MAIQYFKDIVDTKGYRINSKDRQIFEVSDLQSFFGLSDKDAIEFILYDANDNQLPQADYGLVRYVPLTTQNINDYFLIAEGTVFQAYSFPSEYFIDIERLILEAGYNNGIFKTQITLINNRVGSDGKFDKLWISEISPSRTEVRLLPLSRPENVGTDLFERYGILLKDGHFRDDTIEYAIQFIEKITPTSISSFIRNKYGDKWFEKLVSEFKITNFDGFVTNVYNKFMQSALYEFTNRISNIKDLNYGKPYETKPSIELSKDTITNKINELLIRSLDYYLGTPDYSKNPQYKVETDEFSDIVGQVLQRTKSDTTIDTTNPVIRMVTQDKVVQTDKQLVLQKHMEPELPKDGGIVFTPPVLSAPPTVDLPIESAPIYSGGGGGNTGGGRDSGDLNGNLKFENPSIEHYR